LARRHAGFIRIRRVRLLGLRRGLAPLPRFCLPSGRWADWVQRAIQGRFLWTRAGLGQSKREADL